MKPAEKKRLRAELDAVEAKLATTEKVGACGKPSRYLRLKVRRDQLRDLLKFRG